MEHHLGFVGTSKWHPAHLISSSGGDSRVIDESANSGHLQGGDPTTPLPCLPSPQITTGRPVEVAINHLTTVDGNGRSCQTEDEKA